MITVPEAARRTGRNPETIRRWIRSGRLRSTKVGTQHMIDEAALDEVVRPAPDIQPPPEWRLTMDGNPMPDAVAIIREIRDSS